MPITPHMLRHGHEGDGPHRDGGESLEDLAEALPLEDIEVLRAFLTRPTQGLDDVQLAARTKLPLSIVADHAQRLVTAGLLNRHDTPTGRVTYIMGRPVGERRKFRLRSR